MSGHASELAQSAVHRRGSGVGREMGRSPLEAVLLWLFSGRGGGDRPRRRYPSSPEAKRRGRPPTPSVRAQRVSAYVLFIERLALDAPAESPAEECDRKCPLVVASEC